MRIFMSGGRTSFYTWPTKIKKMTVSNNERESLHVKDGKCFVITRILQQGNPNKFVST